jgi:hypothetical protein
LNGLLYVKKDGRAINIQNTAQEGKEERKRYKDNTKNASKQRNTENILNVKGDKTLNRQ